IGAPEGARGDCNVVPVLGQRDRDRLADPPARTGHECLFGHAPSSNDLSALDDDSPPACLAGCPWTTFFNQSRPVTPIPWAHRTTGHESLRPPLQCSPPRR